MAAGKEIRNQIASIKNTQKITSAMEMVAASKMRKAQDRMELGNPMHAIFETLRPSCAFFTLSIAISIWKSVKLSGLVISVVSTDRGLCGGLNVQPVQENDQINESLA